MHRTFGLLATLACAAALLGCGDGKGTEPAGAPIVGPWVYASVTAKPASTDAGAKPNDRPIQLISRVRVEYVFAADGTYTLIDQVMTREASNYTGTWAIVNGKYVVTAKTKNGEAREPTDKSNVISMELKNGDLSYVRPDMPFVFHLRRPQ